MHLQFYIYVGADGSGGHPHGEHRQELRGQVAGGAGGPVPVPFQTKLFCLTDPFRECSKNVHTDKLLYN